SDSSIPRTEAPVYTGDVVVGGPADVRELPGLTVTKVATNPFNNNCYLLASDGEVLLVDAAGDPEVLLGLVAGTLVGVVETHGHWDHWQGLAEVVAATGAPVLATAADAPDLPVPVTRLLSDGDEVKVGSATL